MKSLNYPDILNISRANVASGRRATLNNLELMLLSRKGDLLGDPGFGTNLQDIFFKQNNDALSDLLIDEIYTSILKFMPQLSLSRNDISIKYDNFKVTVSINAINKLDGQADLYTIDLLDSSNQ